MPAITLPPLAELAALAREHLGNPSGSPSPLDKYAPDIDSLHDTADIAAWAGLSPRSLSTMRTRTRPDGTAQFPEPDETFGRSPAWKPRTVAEFYARSPGPGRPRQRQRTSD
jgi:hypothetical protein